MTYGIEEQMIKYSYLLFLAFCCCFTVKVTAQEQITDRSIALIDSASIGKDECVLFNESLSRIVSGSDSTQLVFFLSSESTETAMMPLIGSMRPNDKLTYYAIESASTLETINRIQYLLKEYVKPLDVHLFTSNKSAMKNVPNLKINRIPCREEGEFSTFAVTRKSRALVAEFLRLPLAMVQADTDLVKDLGLDRTKLYELIRHVTDDFEVQPVADDQTIVRVSDLVTYIQNADDLVFQRAYGDQKEQAYVQTVYYGTSRERTASTALADVYSGNRNPKKEISYGTVEVSIPKNHKTGALESPFMGIEWFREDADHLFVKQINHLSQDDFNRLIEEKVGGDSNGDFSDHALVFIHGFNVSFDEASRRIAQLAVDTNFTGIPLFFSWPSDAELLGYMSDREDAVWSVAYVEEFLNNLASLKNVKHIHVIAHSMGNQALIGALHRIAIKQPEKIALFKNVILAAPDFDAQLFEQQIVDDIKHLSDNWTIYTSDKDMALNFSSELNNALRLGLPVTPIEGIQVIDATGVEVSPWNVPEFHSYYATKSKVIKDMVATIRGISPSERELVAKYQDQIRFWELK